MRLIAKQPGSRTGQELISRAQIHLTISRRRHQLQPPAFQQTQHLPHIPRPRHRHMKHRPRRSPHRLRRLRIHRIPRKNHRIRPQSIRNPHQRTRIPRIIRPHRHSHQPGTTTQRLPHPPQHRTAHRKNPRRRRSIRQRPGRPRSNRVHKHLHMARSHHNIRKPLCRLRGYKHIGGGTRSNSGLYGVGAFDDEPPLLSSDRCPM